MTDEEREAADPWMTLAEVGEELRVNPATVRLWISKGQLKASRVGMRKLVVRRSDLDQMLVAVDNVPDESPESTQPETSVDRSQEHEASAEAEPARRKYVPAVGNFESAKQLLKISEQSLDSAFKASALAPPSSGYVKRVRAVADAFEHMSATTIHASRAGGASWSGRSDWGPDRLPYELRPRSNRPWRKGLWDAFDQAFAELSAAMAGNDIVALGEAFRGAADELTAVADQLSEVGGLHVESNAV